jgi:hypothetical protein
LLHKIYFDDYVYNIILKFYKIILIFFVTIEPAPERLRSRSLNQKRLEPEPELELKLKTAGAGAGANQKITALGSGASSDFH